MNPSGHGGLRQPSHDDAILAAANSGAQSTLKSTQNKVNSTRGSIFNPAIIK
jgi:hypothetical protein